MHKRSRIAIAAVLTVCALVAVVPFIWVLLGSFKTTVEIFTGDLLPQTWRYQNYIEAWQRAKFGRNFFNSFAITLVAPIIGVLISVLGGYAFAKLKIRKHTWLFYVFLLGIFIPTEANLLSTSIQVRLFGLHNRLWGLILALVATGVSFGIFLMRNFFREVPDSFGESATIDGAGEMSIFLRIYVPLAKSGIIALLIFNILGAWNEFNLSLFILTDSDKWTIPLAVTTFRQLLGAANFGNVFAAAAMSVLPVLVLYAVFQRSFIEGISTGGIKG